MFISLFLILNINLLIMLINEIEKYLSNNEIHPDILFPFTNQIPAVHLKSFSVLAC